MAQMRIRTAGPILHTPWQRISMVLVMANLTSVGQVELGDGRGQQVMQAWFNRLGARLQHVDLESLL